MSLWLKLKLSILCLVLLGLAAALCIALLPFLVSTDTIRLRLARDLSSITGYNVQLREPPQISVFPVFQAVLPHVVLSDNSENGAPLMDAEKIIVRMSLGDALRRRVRFSETRLIRPHFTLSEPLKASTLSAAFAHSQGSFGSAVRETQNRLQNSGTAAKPDDETEAPLLFQPFGRITIENGLITYPAPKTQAEAAQTAAETAPKEEEISAVNAELNWPLNSNEAALTASGKWHSALTRLDISADDALLLLSGGASNVRISFNSGEGGITFTGKAQAGLSPAAHGRIEARSPGLDKTLRWLQIRPPFGMALTAPFTWQSNFNAKPDAAELKQIILTIGDDAGGDSGRGALDIGYANGLPHISGSLAFEKLNISLPAPDIFTADTEKAARSGKTLNHIVDMPAFNLLGLDIRVSIDKAQFNNVAADNVAASIQMQKNGLIFDIGTMQIFGGSGVSSLRLKSDNDRITHLEARFSAANANLARMRRGFAAFGFALPASLSFDGKANLSLNMQAALPPLAPLPRAKPAHKNKKRQAAAKRQAEESKREQAALAPAPSYYAVLTDYIWPYARGNISFSVSNGRLDNFDMADFIRHLQAGAPFPLQAAVPSQDGKAASFSFDRLESRFTLDKGLFASLNAAFSFGSHRLELGGNADTLKNSLAIEGALDPVRLNSAGQCADTACLSQSLSPSLRFSAAGSFAPAKIARQNAAPQASVEITPKAEILPY